MRAIISDLLDFARTHQGSRLPIEATDCDLGAIIEQAIDEHRAVTSVSIEVELHGTLTGHWDCSRLGQLVSNLITNAVTHGVPGTPVHVSGRGTRESVVLRVQNAGDVIPAAQQRALSKPLSRGARSSERDRQGLGLGLYICEQIVSTHDGSMTFESSAERGVEVTVELPRSVTKVVA